MDIISRNLSVMWNEQLGTDTSFGTKERRLTHLQPDECGHRTHLEIDSTLHYVSLVPVSEPLSAG